MAERRCHLGRPAWLDEGEEPDYRFSLANERTFLAWVRTSLALVAAAVAVVQLVPPFRIPVAGVAIGVALAATALAASFLAYRRWGQNERAMRHAAPLPHSVGLPLLAGAMAVAGAAVIGLLLLEVT